MIMPPLSGIVLLGTLNRLGPWLRLQEGAGVALYIGGFAVLGGLALLPTYAPSLLGGWAFGAWWGSVAALAGFLGAALIGYALSRRVSGDRLQALLSEHTKWNAVYEALLRSGFWKATLIVTLLRLPPNAPFAATNVTMAALRVPVGPYAIGTCAGLAPRTSAVAALGASLSTLDVTDAGQAGYFAGGLILTFVALGIIGWMARGALRDLEARTIPPSVLSRRGDE